MDLALGKRLRGLPGPILVTGHTGFKGTWLTLLLQRLGVEVVGFSLAPESNSLFDRANRTGAISEIFHDICDLSVVESFLATHAPSAVIHMAAQPLVIESYKHPSQTFQTNVMGAVNILEASFNTSSVMAVVVATTDKVYRNDNSGRAFVETDPLAGKDPYSASKVGVEAAVAAWQQISRVSPGPRVVAVRAGNVIGGGDWAVNRLMPDLIRGFSLGDVVTVRNPGSTRPWQHVLDPLLGYLMALETALRGNTIDALNFGPDYSSLTVREVVEISRHVWPSSTKVKYVDNLDEVERESISLQLDSTMARESLHWRPRWQQAESVASTVKWWDNVLNNSMTPEDACRMDIDFLLSDSA